MSLKWYSQLELEDNSVKGKPKLTITPHQVTFGYPCKNETKCSPYIITLNPGRYIFEVWGAQGGGNNTGISHLLYGGKGGYSIGKTLLETPTTFYIYVGSSGTNKTGDGGFNGGGAVGSSRWVEDVPSHLVPRAPGGGATDIRLIKGKLRFLISINYTTTYYGDDDSLHSRIIVAGGGGGNSDVWGYGGGEEGANSFDNTMNEIASSGNQTHGGLTLAGINGGFGYGGYTDQKGQGISGGGGGYFGGGGATRAFGGSGYINKTFFPTGKTKAGNELIPSPYKEGFQELGHSGNGFARITFIPLLITDNLHYFQINMCFLSIVLTNSS